MQVKSTPEYEELFFPDSNLKVLSIQWGISDEIIERILRFDFDKLDIQNGDWSDLSFLKEHTSKIKKLFIGSENCDWSIINDLYNLEELTIGGWFKTSISFSKFTRLKFLDTYWNDGYTDDIYQLPVLEKLTITGGKDISCEKFLTYKNLKSLEIVDSYKLESCDGLEELNKLEEISFVGVRKLHDVKALGKLKKLEMLALEGCNKLLHLQGLGDSKSIEWLYFNRCRNINDYSFLRGDISNIIEILVLINMKIDSLNVLSELSNLKRISLVGSTVADGDLNILFKLDQLESVRLKNGKNFHPTAKQVEAFFEKKQKSKK